MTIRRAGAGEANQRRLNAGEARQREVWPGWDVRWWNKTKAE